MKSYLNMACAVIIMAATANAQHVNVGVKAGLNAYNLSSDQTGYESDTKVGIHIGLLGHIHLAQQLGLQVEAVYSAQGAKASVGDEQLNLTYLNIPVLFQYMFNYGFRIQAGPQLGLLLGAKSEINDVDIKDQFKSIDFGLSIGASYVHVPSGFGVDARYNIGISDISETTDKVTNSGLQIGVFYLFVHHN